MIRSLGFGRTAGGSIYNAYLIVYIIITPFTGYLTDRLGARRVITICLLILGCTVILMGTAIGAWTPFYGAGAILTHWITGLLRDATGVYNQAFMINVVMGVLAMVLICMVREKQKMPEPTKNRRTGMR